MKNFGYYALIMICIVVIIPLLIVRGCGVESDEIIPHEKQNLAGGESIKIKVYIASDKTVKEMNLEEYIKGVVAAEMPADFEAEALKAQAVAARTYAYGRLKNIYKSADGVHDGTPVCTNPAHCQAWISKKAAMKKWGIFKASGNWNKIEKAVDETKGIIITYQGSVVNPLFHSNSGGKTENAENVWPGVSVPYLKSVVSEGEEQSGEFKCVTNISINDFYNAIKKHYPNAQLNKNNIVASIKIEGYTQGGRVKNIKIGNIVLRGTEFRTLFSLRSANFKIEKKDSRTLKITTIGNGHGVGMSQWGANYLAKNGGNYDEILKYYYTGVQISNICGQ